MRVRAEFATAVRKQVVRVDFYENSEFHASPYAILRESDKFRAWLNRVGNFQGKR